MLRAFAAAGVLAALFAAACGGTPIAPSASMSSSTTPAATVPDSGGPLRLTVSPVDVDRIIYITPLGAMAPWGHTLPTDHVYFYHRDGNTPPVPVRAPAAGRIERITNGRIDVRVNSIYSYWIGPLTTAEGIAAGVTVEAGTLLGTHATFPAFDFSVLRSTLRLAFVNPLRYGTDTLTADGPMQYFDGPVRAPLLAKVLRSGNEIDGRLNYDEAGTLAGNWFAEDLPVEVSGRGDDMFYGVRKLSFARDVFSPDQPRISIGGLGVTGLYGTAAGAPAFSSVTTASGLVVYRLMTVGAPQSPSSNQQAGWLLVQLLDATRLRIEGIALSQVVAPASAGPAPAAFSSRAELYLR